MDVHRAGGDPVHKASWGFKSKVACDSVQDNKVQTLVFKTLKKAVNLGEEGSSQGLVGRIKNILFGDKGQVVPDGGTFSFVEEPHDVGRISEVRAIEESLAEEEGESRSVLFCLERIIEFEGGAQGVMKSSGSSEIGDMCHQLKAEALKKCLAYLKYELSCLAEEGEVVLPWKNNQFSLMVTHKMQKVEGLRTDLKYVEEQIKVYEEGNKEDLERSCRYCKKKIDRFVEAYLDWALAGVNTRIEEVRCSLEQRGGRDLDILDNAERSLSTLENIIEKEAKEKFKPLQEISQWIRNEIVGVRKEVLRKILEPIELTLQRAEEILEGFEEEDIATYQSVLDFVPSITRMQEELRKFSNLLEDLKESGVEDEEILAKHREYEKGLSRWKEETLGSLLNGVEETLQELEVGVGQILVEDRFFYSSFVSHAKECKQIERCLEHLEIFCRRHIEEERRLLEKVRSCQQKLHRVRELSGGKNLAERIVSVALEKMGSNASSNGELRECDIPTDVQQWIRLSFIGKKLDHAQSLLTQGSIEDQRLRFARQQQERELERRLLELDRLGEEWSFTQEDKKFLEEEFQREKNGVQEQIEKLEKSYAYLEKELPKRRREDMDRWAHEFISTLHQIPQREVNALLMMMDELYPQTLPSNPSPEEIQSLKAFLRSFVRGEEWAQKRVVERAALLGDLAKVLAVEEIKESLA